MQWGEGTLGKNEFLDNVVVMKSVYKEINEPAISDGMTTMATLTGYHTAPALKLLEKRTWRNFFDEMKSTGGPYKWVENKNSGNSSSHNPQPQRRGSGVRRPRSAVGAGEGHAHSTSACARPTPSPLDPSNMAAALNDAFVRMCRRVEMLWDEVKMSACDQQFYRSSLLKGPPKSVEHCKEIARYIRALQLHRALTINVLRAIAEREQALEACFDSFAAVHRRMMREGNQDRTTVQEKAKAGLLGFWREEICSSLADLQRTSLNVVRLIQAWRRAMWRPRAFLWRDQNYLLKIKVDMGILEAESYASLLQRLSVPTDALLCVSFTDPALYRRTERKMPVRKAPSAKAAASSLEEKMNALAMGVAPSSEGSARALHDSLDEVREQLLQAGTVVLEEEMLQMALAQESQTLRAKRVFIPSLKVPTSLDEHSRLREGGASGAAPPGTDTANANSSRSNNNNIDNGGGGGIVPPSEDPFSTFEAEARGGNNRSVDFAGAQGPFRLNISQSGANADATTAADDYADDDFELFTS